MPRYFTAALGSPYLATSSFIMSSAGSQESALAGAYQLGCPMMSWPDLACCSAAPTSMSLSPWLVMKSRVNSTFSLSAHSWAIAFSTSLAPGTQWSHTPIDSLPAAWAPRTNGRGSALAAAATAPVFSIARRVNMLVIFPPSRTRRFPGYCPVGATKNARVRSLGSRSASPLRRAGSEAGDVVVHQERIDDQRRGGAEQRPRHDLAPVEHVALD